MKKVISRVINGTCRVNWLLGAASAIVGFALIGIVVYGVIVRYVFRQPTAYSLELPEVLFIAIIALALVYTQMQGSHVRVEVIVSRLRGKAKDTFSIITNLATIVYCGIVVWALWQRAIWNLERNMGTIQNHIPLAPFSFLIVVGIGLLAIQVIIETVRLLSSKEKMEASKPHH